VTALHTTTPRTRAEAVQVIPGYDDAVARLRNHIADRTYVELERLSFAVGHNASAEQLRAFIETGDAGSMTPVILEQLAAATRLSFPRVLIL
jgi:hypothetical protein